MIHVFDNKTYVPNKTGGSGVSETTMIAKFGGYYSNLSNHTKCGSAADLELMMLLSVQVMVTLQIRIFTFYLQVITTLMGKYLFR